MSLRFKLILAVLALGLVGAPSMWGTTIDPTCTIAVEEVGYTFNCTGLPQFNPSSGTLNSVTLQLTGVGGFVWPTQTNNGSSDFNFQGSSAQISMTMTGPDGLTVTVTPTSGLCSGTVDAHSENTSCTQTPFTPVSSGVVTLTSLSPGGLGAFEGTGTMSFEIDTSGFLIGASGGNSSLHVTYGGDGSIGGTLDVTYNYTPPPPKIPEPATLLLMGGSLTVFGMMFRKRFPRPPAR